MNDLESKLRALTFREPPPGWRGSMVSVAITESSWRKWFAPHPAAWAALATIWLVLAFVSQRFEKTSTPEAVVATAPKSEPLSEPALFVFQLRVASGAELPL